VVRALDVRSDGAIVAVRELLWRLMDRGVVQGLLAPLQTNPRESPAPTLIKNRERLEKANPLAPVMSLNSAKVAGMLLGQGSDKKLGVVLRPCEARSLVELANCGAVSLDRLVTISIDCLGSHDEGDYEQRISLWGDDVPVRESLRWSRLGQIASYRFRRACQVCERPTFDGADVSIGLFGQRLAISILVFTNDELAEQIGIDDDFFRPRSVAPDDDDLLMRRRTIQELVARRHSARIRAFSGLDHDLDAATDLLAHFDECSLCGGCQDACPLTATPVSRFEIGDFAAITPEYSKARLLDIALRSNSCSGCGMCEEACSRGIPLMLIAQLLSDRADLRSELVNAFVGNPVA